MGIFIANGSVFVREQLMDALRRLIPRLLVTVFLTILCVVYLTRCAVFISIASLAFQK